MHSRPRTGRVSRRALVALTATAALTVGAVATVPAAQAATPGTSAAIYGTTDATYDGVYRQSLAILGLHAAGFDQDPAAVQWLLDQQCTNHGFTSFDEDPRTRCTAPNGPGGADSNATAVAVQALLAVGKTAQAQAAARFLRANQATDGGWEYTIGSGWGSDPNSTALALTALDAAGLTPSADPAPSLAAKQVGRVPVDNADVPADNGAIAYSTVGEYAGPDDYATSQAIPGLNGLNLVDVAPPASWAEAPATYASTPAADAAGIAGWATTWLAGRADAGTIGSSSLAWSILAFSSNATAKAQAHATYAKLRSGVLDFATNPAALGQSALAAAAIGTVDEVTQFGSTPDLTRYARLIEQTLTPAVVTPSLVAPPAATPKDTSKPKAKLTRPSKFSKVASWRTLRGTSSDTGSGVKSVTVTLVEKRGASWYAYTGKRWTKKSTLAKATKSAKRLTVAPKKSGAWTLKVKKLTKGTLKVSVFATDKAGNRSASKTTTAKLTKQR